MTNSRERLVYCVQAAVVNGEENRPASSTPYCQTEDYYGVRSTLGPEVGNCEESEKLGFGRPPVRIRNSLPGFALCRLRARRRGGGLHLHGSTPYLQSTFACNLEADSED